MVKMRCNEKCMRSCRAQMFGYGGGQRYIYMDLSLKNIHMPSHTTFVITLNLIHCLYQHFKKGFTLLIDKYLQQILVIHKQNQLF